jgi:YYY domain-containing protein
VLNPWTAFGLVALLVAAILVLIRDLRAAIPGTEHETRNTAHASRFTHHAPCTAHHFALLLFATGALLVLSVEYVYLRDNFGTRMNTVFKFYFQAWVMWGVAGAYALAGFVRRGRVGVVVAIGLLIAAGLIYPALAIPARAREHGGPPTLDGAAHLAGTHPDDYAAIRWLNANVDGAPVILEAPGDRFRAYVYEGRVAAHTGLPTLLGWAGHEHQWRGSGDEQALREPDIETLYTSVDPDEVLTLLDKYGISYVYVGPLERERYPTAGLAKFAEVMQVVYDTGPVTIYRR